MSDEGDDVKLAFVVVHPQILLDPASAEREYVRTRERMNS